MQVSEFKYLLPPELIAQQPLADRAASRLLHLDRSSPGLLNRQFREFPQLLRPDDLVIFNNTKVFPARLFGRRSASNAQALSSGDPASREFLQGEVEVLLTGQVSSQPNDWECLVRPGRKIGVGEHLFFGRENELHAEITAPGRFGERQIRFAPVEDFFSLLERLGHVPLPPYIKRPDGPEDRERYQTVYAKERGSVAAPTAGLHFTPEVLAGIQQRAIETAEITLHVGLGTFQPVREERVEANKLHSEPYFISSEAAERINSALQARRRVVAIGTTTVRALEHSAFTLQTGGVQAGRALADIFIYPGYEFRLTGAMLSNFHLPQSTLLMLVCAFGGTEAVLQAYHHAVERKYRFYSYGDCMFME